VVEPRRIIAIVSAVGLVVAVAGTFLPWFRSGRVSRDSYEIVGLGLRFDIADDTFLRGLLASWSAVPVVCTVCCVLFALRVYRVAAVLAGCSAGAIGTVAVFFLVQGSTTDTSLAVVPTGPATSVAGAALALLAACGVFVVQNRRARARKGTVRSTS